MLTHEHLNMAPTQIQLQEVHSRMSALLFLSICQALSVLQCYLLSSFACMRPPSRPAQEMCGRLLLDCCSLASRDQAWSQLLLRVMLHKAASSGCLLLPSPRMHPKAYSAMFYSC